MLGVCQENKEIYPASIRGLAPCYVSFAISSVASVMARVIYSVSGLPIGPTKGRVITSLLVGAGVAERAVRILLAVAPLRLARDR